MKVSREKNPKEGKPAIIGVVVFSVVIAFLFGYYLWQNSFVGVDNTLSGVLLENGEIYFGRLSYFPRLTLSNVYTIQATVDSDDPTQISYQIIPLTLSVWSPGKLFLNYDNILFIGDVGEDSQVMQIIREYQNQ